MAFHQVTSTNLTPSRPAPQAPQRRAGDASPQPSFTGVNSGYNSSFAFSSSSPSASSYVPSYTGVGGTPLPNRTFDSSSSQIVRSGPVSVKEEGTFASWIWKLKWLVLKEETLTIHKSEVGLIVVHDPFDIDATSQS